MSSRNYVDDGGQAQENKSGRRGTHPRCVVREAQKSALSGLCMPGSVHELCDVQQKVGEEKVRLHFADGKTRPRGIGASTALSSGRRSYFLPFEVLWFDSSARKRKQDDLRVSSVRFALSRRETAIVRQGAQQIFHRQTFRQDRVHAPQPSP